MQKPVWIVGGTGMLGRDLTRLFRDSGNWDVLSTGSRELDITKPEAIAACLRSRKPALVINASAFTNVDLAERELIKATELNGVAPGTLAVSCQEFGIPFVHYSTDQVFDGSGDKPWTEEDHPKPLNHYAASKWQGEKSACTCSGSLVFRVQWLYGDAKDRFTILKDKESFTPFVDQFGAPTWTEDIARITMQAVEKKLNGLYHLSYDDYGSWYDVYETVCRTMKYPTKLIATKTEDVTLPAQRPKNCRLSNAKLRASLGLPGLGGWRERLEHFLHRKQKA